MTEMRDWVDHPEPAVTLEMAHGPSVLQALDETALYHLSAAMVSDHRGMSILLFLGSS